jgi:hypothetical protein
MRVLSVRQDKLGWRGEVAPETSERSPWVKIPSG